MYKLMKNSHSIYNEKYSVLEPVEKRLQNDLLDIKNARMTTNLFYTQMSDIIRDGENNNYKLFLSMENLNFKYQLNVRLHFVKNYRFA
jgi:hypothetical protein